MIIRGSLKYISNQADLAIVEISDKSFFTNTKPLEITEDVKIKALQGEYKGLYRLRLRTYRLIYEKQNDKLVILVLRVSHRKDIY